MGPWPRWVVSVQASHLTRTRASRCVACYYLPLEVWRLITPEATRGRSLSSGPSDPRVYRSSDAAGILAVDLACAESGDGMVLDREQIDRDLAVIDRRLLGSELQQVFVADVASEVAGYASVRKLFSGRVRHVAIAAVAVHPRFQRQGIGRALMRAAISWADTAQVSRLELYVRSDNARAIALYTSLGFELEGVRRGFIRTLRGELIDDFIMVRFAPQLDPAAS